MQKKLRSFVSCIECTSIIVSGLIALYDYNFRSFGQTVIIELLHFELPIVVDQAENLSNC